MLWHPVSKRTACQSSWIRAGKQVCRRLRISWASWCSPSFHRSLPFKQLQKQSISSAYLANPTSAAPAANLLAKPSAPSPHWPFSPPIGFLQNPFNPPCTEHSPDFLRVRTSWSVRKAASAGSSFSSPPAIPLSSISRIKYIEKETAWPFPWKATPPVEWTCHSKHNIHHIPPLSKTART